MSDDYRKQWNEIDRESRYYRPFIEVIATAIDREGIFLANLFKTIIQENRYILTFNETDQNKRSNPQSVQNKVYCAEIHITGPRDTLA